MRCETLNRHDEAECECAGESESESVGVSVLAVWLGRERGNSGSGLYERGCMVWAKSVEALLRLPAWLLAWISKAPNIRIELLS